MLCNGRIVQLCVFNFRWFEFSLCVCCVRCQVWIVPMMYERVKFAIESHSRTTIHSLLQTLAREWVSWVLRDAQFSSPITISFLLLYCELKWWRNNMKRDQFSFFQRDRAMATIEDFFISCFCNNVKCEIIYSKNSEALCRRQKMSFELNMFSFLSFLFFSAGRLLPCLVWFRLFGLRCQLFKILIILI